MLQQWTHLAAFGDASAAVAMGETLMFVANNEDEVLRLYARYPVGPCDTALYGLDVRPSLNPTTGHPSADLEAAVKLTNADGTRIYWIGSHSNTRTGNLRPDRYRLFATQVEGDGTGSPPYTLTYVGRYDHLRADLVAWDKNNLHGLGANYFRLEASTADGVNSTSVDGFSIEGLAIGPDGTSAYIGFRTPRVNGSGATTKNGPRTHALIVPLLNMPALVTGNPTPGPGAAQFGEPIRLDLGSRGVRSIDCAQPVQYLVVAGPADDPSNPPVAPLNFRLFTWSGWNGTPALERSTDILQGWGPEGAIVPKAPLSDTSVVQFVSDDATACWRSFTAALGAMVSTTGVPPEAGGSGGIRFSRPPSPNPTRAAVTFAVANPREQRVDISVHDVQGRRVATLWQGPLPAGEREFVWDGATPSRVRARPGVYVARLEARDATLARRFALLR